ncbi:anti-sigma factor [Streptomyces johnsoniae]|uniref:Zinc-finger domain-containing protein n=1 Tax=Streptomyces johnsoniae TaxID=3075532 RepID=A0ABU2SAK6_9ACTN|nr:hypothetical protein [Streptomyces sp. DSM 41886]MDT0445990.1 hypothetical protein [Streptomyces sp. DSM 41886]
MNDVHPEPADLAALDEDLLPPDETARLRDHLTRCSACVAVQADLTALRQALHELPDPGPMPDDIAARIDAAIAVEPRPAAPAAPVSRETAHQRLARRDRRHRRMRLGLAAVGALVFLGFSGTLLSSIDLEGGTSDDGGGGAESAADSAEQFNESTESEPLENQVRELLATAESNDPLLAEGNEESDPSAPDQPSSEPETMAALPACVEEAIGRPEAPLAAEEEDYAGVDAYLVVLPHPADPERVDAYVVTATCASASPSASGEILVRESYPRE